MRLHIKKFLLSFFVIVAFAVYAAYQRNLSGGIDPAVDLFSDFGGTEAPASSNIPTPSAIAQKLPISAPSPASPKPSAVPPTPKPPTPSPTHVASPTPIPSPIPTPAPKSLYKDGQYTGSSADAYYGNVQVAAIIQGGKITDVQFLDYPRDRGHSIEVNAYATPILKSEAIQAQSAKVDIVSGATDTSNAFIESLSSALNQARN